MTRSNQNNTKASDKQIVSTAVNIVLAFLSYGEPTALGLNEMYNIRSGDKELLLSHLKAIQSIINKAIDILDSNE